jgi:transcriptional regulator with XRE-family HTH domain
LNIIFDQARFAAYARAKRDRLTINQAAKEAGISPAAMCRIENGFIPSLSIFIAICQWVGLDPAFFFLDGEATDQNPGEALALEMELEAASA